MDPNEMLEKLVKECYADFKPTAYYDKHLDCIRVQIEDCSFTEKRMNRIFTVLSENHVEQPNYIGFTIKGVRHLFKTLGLPESGVIKLVDIIDRIVGKYPDEVAKFIRDTFHDSPVLEAELDLAA